MIAPIIEPRRRHRDERFRRLRQQQRDDRQCAEHERDVHPRREVRDEIEHRVPTARAKPNDASLQSLLLVRLERSARPIA
jgi:hypothetical protein